MTLTMPGQTIKMVLIAIGGIVVGVPLLVAVVLVVKNLADAPKPTCGSLTANAPPADQAVQHFLIEAPGNGTEAADEAGRFVRDRVTGLDDPGAALVVEVDLFTDGHLYVPHDASACLGRPVAIAANKQDRESLASASGQQAEDLRKSLVAQKQAQLALLVHDVEAAVQKTPAPSRLSGSALPVWLQAAQLGEVPQLAILAPFAAGGDDCLTIADPAGYGSAEAAAGAGGAVTQAVTWADARVQKCTGIETNRALDKVSASHLLVQAAQATHPTPSQIRSQMALIEALCHYATKHGCSN